MKFKKISRKQPLPYDALRFVSKEASDRYNALLNRHEIKERGFDLREGPIGQQIKERKWDKFARQPSYAVMPVVREFYANLPEHEEGRVFVRDMQVPFDRTAINNLFDLADIPDDHYSVLKARGVDPIELLESLCPVGGSWKMSRGEFISFPANLLRRETRAWHYFLTGRFMPTSHTSNVTKSRAELLYALVLGKSIDIGEIIHSQILCCGTTNVTGLFFPSLITSLCRAAGVTWYDAEEKSAPRHVIDVATYLKIQDLPGMPQENADAPPPTHSRPSPSTATSSGTLSAQIQELRTEVADFKQQHAQYQQFTSQCFEVIGKMYHQWVARCVPRTPEHHILRMPIFSAAGASSSHQPAPHPPEPEAETETEEEEAEPSDDAEVEIIAETGPSRRFARTRSGRR